LEQLLHPKTFRFTVIALFALLSVASFYLSYGALFELARSAGFATDRALLFPVTIDAVLLVALILAMGTPGRAVLAWSVVWLFSAITVAGNSFHTLTIPPELITMPTPVAALISALPGLSLLACSHLAAHVLFARPMVAAQPGLRPVVISMAADSVSVKAISLSTGVPRSTVARWIKQASSAHLVVE
jgi:hypothetical protein